MKKALINVTTEDLIKSVMCFHWTDSVLDKAKAMVFNGAQKGVSSLSRIAHLWQQRALIAAANHGKAGWCRILPHHLQALRGMVPAKFFAMLPRCTNLLRKSTLGILMCPAGTSQAMWMVAELMPPKRQNPIAPMIVLVQL